MEKIEENRLRNYTHTKQQVGDLLHSSLLLFHQVNDESAEEECRMLLAKLAEDRFNLVVVGQFKRGKSSLMNAIIGRNLLPTGLLPLTSAITTLCYGPQEKVSIIRSGWILEQEISLSELPGFVTEEGNPGNIKGVIEARVQLPISFLRHGLFFIDTPGIGSTLSENTATTYSFLPQSDAVIFVTSVETPLSESEGVFLQDVQQYTRRLFVAVNKIDLLASHEYEQMLGYINKGISKILGKTEVRLYPISARFALESKLNGDHQNNYSQGLHTLEADLEKFITEEKSQLFLVSMLDHLLKILAEHTTNSKTGKPYSDETRTQLNELSLAANALQNSLLGGTQLYPAPMITVPVARASREIDSSILTRIHPTQKTLKTHTCSICAALSKAAFDFFAQFQNQLTFDRETRLAFANSRGFCQVHTWQFEQVASPLGISEGYVSLVELIASELKQASSLPPRQSVNLIDGLLSDGNLCPACRFMQEEEVVQRDRFLDYIATEEGQDNYRHSLGLCLVHLKNVLASSPSLLIAEFLMTEQARHLEELSEDMHSYTFKRDAIRRYLLRNDEKNAWKFALIQIVGERTAHIENRKKIH